MQDPTSMSRRGFLSTGAAGVGIAVMHPFSAQAKAGQAHLRIMETTDLHVHIWPYDYYADKPVDTVGLARTTALVQAVRGEATNSILLDNGDFLQGNPLGDYIAYERGMAKGQMHPIITAMNTAGVEGGALGNHEFNYGLDFLKSTISGAAFPVVCCNVATVEGDTPDQDATLVPPYAILERELTDGAGQTHPIRVGLIGFVPPQIMQWDRKHLEGNVTARDIVEAARAWVPVLREQGVDLIIALSHSGIAAPSSKPGAENASLALAAVDGIDVVLTGHQHMVFPSPHFAGIEGVDTEAATLNGKPAVMAGYWGSHMGLIDLLLEYDEGSWTVAGHSVEARPIYERDADQQTVPLVESVSAVEKSVTPEHQATLEYVRQFVGKTSVPLNSYFALVVDDPSVQLVTNAQAWYMRQMLTGTEHADLPLLSAGAPFKGGGHDGPDSYTDIPAGDIAIKNVADLYIYPNTICAVKITGSQLKNWLERSAGMFNQIEAEHTDQPLLNPAFPSYNFDVIDGVTYAIDLSQPSKFDENGAIINPDANRITGLSRDGQPVAPDAEFIVATNIYRAGGGGNFPGNDGTTIIFEGPDTNRDLQERRKRRRSRYLTIDVAT